MPQDPSATLRSLELLRGATSADLANLAALMSIDTVESGVRLSREGDMGDKFWIVIDGVAEVTASTTAGERRLALAGRGAILGELALLRGRPRSASVRTLEVCRVASGGPEALEVLLGIEDVRQRIQELASRRLAEDCRPLRLTLRDGSSVLLRPLLPSDRARLAEAARRLSAESLRRRFFSASPPSQKLLDYLVDIDFVEHFAWVVIDPASGEGMATARYVRTSMPGEAEVAFATTDDNQGRGLGTLLLGAIGVAAAQARIDRLVAHVLDDNTAMRAVFAKADATTARDEPGIVSVTIETQKAALLIEPAMRGQLAGAVHDIVTAASVALIDHPNATATRSDQRTPIEPEPT